MPKHTRWRQLGLCLVFLSLLWCGQALAADPVGWVSVASGPASVISDGQELPAQPEMPIAANDTLKTGQDGAMQVVFRDDTLLSMGAGSELLVRDVFTPEGEGSFHLTVLTGAARLITSKVASANPDRFELDTPLASIGIRGTEFGVLVGADHETVLLNAGGPVLVSPQAGDGSQGTAQICDGLAQAKDKTQIAYDAAKANHRTIEKSKMNRQMSEIEELEAQYGCTP